MVVTIRKKHMITEILQCMAANDCHARGETWFDLIFADESALVKICQELCIKVQPKTKENQLIFC